MPHVETAKEALDIFESGEPIQVVELGGLGPGYEQAIWVGIFRLLDVYHDKDMDDWIDGEKFKESTWEELSAYLEDLGLSGAQFSAIRSTTFQLIKFGWKFMMDKAPEDRLILVSKEFPSYEKKEDKDA